MSHDHDDPRYPVRKSDEEWRAGLDANQYQVARHAATERAFTGAYWDHWNEGRYHCVGCGQVLFESKTKFDAGCGWPSYWRVGAAAVSRRRCPARSGSGSSSSCGTWEISLPLRRG